MLGEEALEILGQATHVLFLRLEGDQATPFARLEIEDPLTGDPHGTGAEVVGGLEVERVAHGASSIPRSRAPELTVMTTGPSGR